MLEMKEYEPTVFENLNDFHIAKMHLEQEEDKITQLGDIIRHHKLEKHVGVSLLHKHYDVFRNERVVREFDGNIAYMKPRMVFNNNNVTPYIWKLEGDNEQKHFYPLEFVEIVNLTQVAREEAEIITSSHEFLSDMADKLGEFELEDVFGLTSLHSLYLIHLENGETLLELTDHQARTLTLSPIAVSALKALNTTQTLWVFTPHSVEAEIDCGPSHCGSHCYQDTHG